MKRITLITTCSLLLLVGCNDSFLSSPAPQIQRIFFTNVIIPGYGFPTTPAHVASINIDGTGLRILGEDSSYISSSPVGGRMAYLHYTASGAEVVVADTSGANRIVLDNVGIGQYIATRNVALSTDGKTVIYIIEETKTVGSTLWAIGIDGQNKRQVQLGDLSVRSTPQFSTDSRSIAFVAGTRFSLYTSPGNIFVVDIATLNVRKVADSAHRPFPDGGLAWSPKGDRIAFFKAGVSSTSADSISSQIAIVDLSSGIVRSVTNPIYYGDPDLYPSTHWPHDGLCWSPDDKHLAFCSGPTDNGYDLWMVETSGANLINLSNSDGLKETSPHWSPDGKEILYSALDPVGIQGSFLKRFNVIGMKETAVGQNSSEGFWEQ